MDCCIPHCTRRVMIALISLQDEPVCLPSDDKKRQVKKYTSDHGFKSWRNGFMAQTSAFPRNLDFLVQPT
ncbi:hypothetical protein BC835DRAFT_1282659 [Cytidiella melzeri]|nr:hypothetical protein BC835DRAFT_1282659 [Cytidiella melzeri]